MKKLLGIALIIIIMTSLLAGCGEHVKGDGAARVQTSETENDQEDGLIQENDLDEVEEPTAESTVGEKQKSASEEQAYLDDAAVGQYSVYSHYYMNGREIHFLEGETIDDYFDALEPDDVSFDYEDGTLVHMYEECPHGSVDRFYFYKSGDYSYRCGPCMLEVDHGWGVTFYRF